MFMPQMMQMQNMQQNMQMQALTRQNIISLAFNPSLGRFDHGTLNPLTLGPSANDLENALTEIEQQQEVAELKKTFQDIEGLQTLQTIGFILFICVIGIFILCIGSCQASSLQKKLRTQLGSLKIKADDILKKYNPNLNSQGKHATTRLNEMLLINPQAAKMFAQQFFFVQVTLHQDQMQQQVNQQAPLLAFN